MDKKTRRGRPTKEQAAEIRQAKETIAAIKAAAEARRKQTRSTAMKKWHKSRKPHLDFKDKDFFKKLGSMGGKSTAKNLGPEYYRAIAVLAHQVTRERAAVEAERLEAQARTNGKR